jgi:WD40 repeat protein
LHDVFLDQAPFYVEMDYVEGTDLRSWCQEHGGPGAIPLETRLEIVAQAADGLQAAHEAGIIHRDVKPANILIGGKDTGPTDVHIKLTDFGIGQVVSEEYFKGITRAGFTQTMAGGSSSSGTGTQLYMAPELLAGKPASTRADIYSLGVVLYQLLVGDFTRPVTTDWTRNITDSLLRDDLEHCFAGDPNERFGGVAELAKNLRALEHRKAAQERERAEQAERERLRQQVEHRRRLFVAAAGVALVLGAIAVALGYGLNRAEKQRRLAEAYLYDADMNLAGQALEENNRGRALSFLNLHRPAQTGQLDLRGWEWRYLWEKCRSDELATLGQHDGDVQCVAVSPDGKWVASGGFDGPLRIWALAARAAGGRSVTNLQLGGSPISGVAFSPDGRWLAASTWANGFVVFQTQGWQREWTVTNTEAGLEPSVAFSADSRLLAVGNEVWGLETRTRLRALPCRKFNSGDPAVAWLPNSQTLAGFGSSNGLYSVSLFDVNSTKPDATVCVIPLRIEVGRWRFPGTLAFSPDGKYLAIGSWDNTVRIHAANDWRQLKTLTNHTAGVSSVAFSNDGQWLASASADHSIRLWRTGDWQEAATLRGHLDEVYALAFTPNGQRLVSGSRDDSVRLWPVADRSRPVEEVTVSAEGARWLGLSGLCPFAVGPSNLVTIWDCQTLQVRQRLSSYPVANVVGWSPSPDGRSLLMRTVEGGLWLTDLAPGAGPPPVCLQTNGSRLREIAFSDRAKWVAVTEPDALRVWNLKRPSPWRGSTLATGNFCRPRFSQDERLLSAHTDPIQTAQTVFVWDLTSGKELVHFQPHRDAVTDLAFSPDGTVLATSSQDNTCKLYDLRRQREVRTLRGQLLALFSVCFSPDGRRLAAGIGDGRINIWDLETGREVLVLRRRANLLNFVSALRFHPNGDWLLSADERAVHLWRAPSWEEIDAAEKKTQENRQ